MYLFAKTGETGGCQGRRGDSRPGRTFTAITLPFTATLPLSAFDSFDGPADSNLQPGTQLEQPAQTKAALKGPVRPKEDICEDIFSKSTRCCRRMRVMPHL